MDKKLINVPCRRPVRLQELDCLSELDKPTKSLGLKVLPLALVLSLMFSSLAQPTYALYRKMTGSPAVSLKTDDISHYLLVTKGKATHDTCLNPSHAVAIETDNHSLALDFGTILPGDKDDFHNVLWLKNLSSKTLKVMVEVEGNIAPLITSIAGQKDKLAFDLPVMSTSTNTVTQTVYGSGTNPFSLDLVLNPGSQTKPGLYEGILKISVNGNFYVQKIPMKVVIPPPSS